MFDLSLLEPYPLTTEPFYPVTFPTCLIKLYTIPYHWDVTVSIIGTGPKITVSSPKNDHNARCCGWSLRGKHVFASYHSEEVGQILSTGVFIFDPKKYNKMDLNVRGWDRPRRCSCPIFIHFADEDDSKIIGFNVSSDAEHLPVYR